MIRRAVAWAVLVVLIDMFCASSEAPAYSALSGPVAISGPPAPTGAVRPT